MFPEWTWICGLLMGAAIGSFLNVVIYRMPRGLSLSNPPKSFCPACKHPLGVLDLFPLLSWLLLRGQCRYCKARIGARYFFVELLTGSIWAGIWYEQLVQTWDPARAVCLFVFASALIAAIFIDLRWYIIPDQVNAVLLVAGIAYNISLFAQNRPEAVSWGVPSSLAGGLFGIGILWGIALIGRLMFGKDAMGHGDIKMARGIGAMLFPLSALISFALAVGFGAVFGILQILIRRSPPPNENAEDQPAPPETIGSLLVCGVGYVLCIDVIGLFIPKLYERWFGENPYSIEAGEEEMDVEFTMIPFGPYLALGALAASLFNEPLSGWLHAYWRHATGEI